MNLKKTILSLMAAGTLLMGGMGVANAADITGNTGAKVTISGVGDPFNVQFCTGDVDFQTHSLSSVAPTKKVEAIVGICYHDNAAYRGYFRTYLSAGQFSNTTDGVAVIPATNLSPKFMSNVEQGQWGTLTDGSKVGGIGAMSGNANYNAGAVNTPGGAVTTWPGQNWVGGNLSTEQYISYGNPGVGTGGTKYLASDNSGYTIPGNPLNTPNTRLDNGSIQRMSLELTIPSNATIGVYTSTLTLNVYLGLAP